MGDELPYPPGPRATYGGPMSTLARRAAPPAREADPPTASRGGGWWTALVLPVGLAVGIVALAFSGGGFFAGATGVAEALCFLALAAWVVLARPRPLSRPLAVAVGGLAAFAVWVFLSSGWSHAPGRALLEGDRALLYAAVVALCGFAAADRRVRALIPAAITAALVVISVCGLITRLLPHLWPIADDVEFQRLSYPLGYWNGQGALGAVAAVGALHLAADRALPRGVRALAAAALPLVATSIVLTFSRGSIGVGLIGVVLYLLLARPRHAVAALAAAGPTAALAVAAALSSDAVVEEPTVSAAGVHAGARVAVVVALCAVAAGGLYLLLGRAEPWLDRHRLSRLPHARWLAAAALVIVVGGGIAAGAPAVISRHAEQLTRSSHVKETPDARARLTALSDNGRIDAWKVSLDGFSSSPLHGTGAGTFALEWDLRRPSIQDLNDGHSLLFETLGELGVVGLALLLLGLGALLAGNLAALRSPERTAAAAGTAILVTWFLHAAIDWDWELPALTLPVLALAAATAAASGGRRRQRPVPGTATSGPLRPGWALRGGIVVALLVLAATGAGVAASQHLLDDSVHELNAGNCAAATRSANHAVSVFSQRAEPHQVLAVCALRSGQPEAALSQIQLAHRLDPGNWRLIYDIGMVQALRGGDPRASIRAARARNPRSWLLRQTQERFAATPRKYWPTLAQRAGLLV